MLQKRVIEYSGLGPVTFWRRAGNRSIRISVKSRGGVLVTYPWYTPFAQAEHFLLQNGAKVQQMLSRVGNREEKSLLENYLKSGNESAKGRETASGREEEAKLAALRKRAKESLPSLTAEMAAKLRTLHKRSFAYRRICIKRNRSNWGSCSAKNNINLNLSLPLLPDALRNYVIIHELCHLEHHNHGTEFHQLLNSSCLALLGCSEQELVKELRRYWI